MEKNAQLDIVETAELPAPEEVVVMDETPMDAMVIVEEPKGYTPGDYEKSEDVRDFESWMSKKLQSLPKHSGNTTAGVERIMAYLRGLDKEISRAMAKDTDVSLDDQKMETFRKQIRKMTKQLEKRHKEINDAYDADDAKYASENKEEIVKEAQELKSEEAKEVGAPELKYSEAVEEFVCDKCHKKFATKDALDTHKIAEHNSKSASTCGCDVKTAAEDTCPKCNVKLWKAAEGLWECIACDEVYERPIKKEANTAKVRMFITPFQRAITGIIINGIVANGKKAEEVFSELDKTYKFSDREKLEIGQILLDMGYTHAPARNFMAFPHGNEVEMAVNYNA